MSSATNKLNRSEVAESSYIPVYPDLLSPGDYDSQPATSHCSAVDILKEPSPELRNNQQRFFIDVENTNPKYDVCHLPVTTAAKIAAIISMLGAMANGLVSLVKISGGQNLTRSSCFGINLAGSLLTMIFSSLCLAGVIQERSGLLIPAIVWKLIAFLCLIIAGILASLGLAFVSLIRRQTQSRVEVVSVLQSVDTRELSVTLVLSITCSVLIGLILVVLKRCYFYLRYKSSAVSHNHSNNTIL